MQVIRELMANAANNLRRPLINSHKSNLHYNPLIKQFTNLLMKDGKKQKSMSILLRTLDTIEKTSNQEPFGVLQDALSKARPLVALKKRKLKSRIELQPRSLAEKQGNRIAIKWLIKESANRKDPFLHIRLAKEIVAAASNEGEVIKKKNTLHEEVAKTRSALFRVMRLIK